MSTAEARPMEKRYTLENDLAPIIEGRIEVPNYSPIPTEEIPLWFTNLAAVGHGWLPKWGWAKLPGSTSKVWAFYFLTSYMGSDLDGAGYVVPYFAAYGRKLTDQFVARFAICKHEKADAAGANHERGWHPGYCRKCGMNMTYDSGD